MKNDPQACIQAFAGQYGEAYLRLAYHAALPMALTPDLLYRIWSNIQNECSEDRDVIPWEAVSDFLTISGFCESVGYDLYEIDPQLRQALLRCLENDSRFGSKRIQELAEFIFDYANVQLGSGDLAQQDYAKVQRWGALAYIKPKQVARELNQELSRTYLRDEADLNRIANVVLSLQEQLKHYPALLSRAKKASLYIRGRKLGIFEFFGSKIYRIILKVSSFISSRRTAIDRVWKGFSTLIFCFLVFYVAVSLYHRSRCLYIQSVLRYSFAEQEDPEKLIELNNVRSEYYSSSNYLDQRRRCNSLGVYLD